MTVSLPTWALQPATPHDRERVEQAHRRDTLRITWPASSTLRTWAKLHGWPTPWRGFEDAFIAKMLESDANFDLALNQTGIAVLVPVRHVTLTADRLRELDGLYAARGPDGRPSDWGNLVEALREIRRAVEAGVVVEVDGRNLTSFAGFYTWAHGRYHMLEDGYDRWIGDDR